jgi:predicted ATPase
MPGRRSKRGSFGSGPDLLLGAYLRSVMLVRERVSSFDHYPFSIPAIRNLQTLAFHPRVTFLVGENGVGKSTLVEAIAVAAGFNAEGGSKSFNFSTHDNVSELHEALRLIRGPRRERDGYFLRAESLYNVASEIERLDDDSGFMRAYGGRSLHAQSHGEAFMALALHRFRGAGLYILDEPEAALAPSRQLAMLVLIHRLVKEADSQFVIATHSPILMAYPDATIYHLSAERDISPIAYEDTEHFRVTRDFLNNRDAYLSELLSDDSHEPPQAE